MISQYHFVSLAAPLPVGPHPPRLGVCCASPLTDIERPSGPSPVPALFHQIGSRASIRCEAAYLALLCCCSMLSFKTSRRRRLPPCPRIHSSLTLPAAQL